MTAGLSVREIAVEILGKILADGLTVDEAAAQFPEASRMFEQPIIDREYFLNLADSFRSPHLWTHENGEWKLRHTVWDSGAGPA